MRRIDALAQGDRRHDPATAAAVLVDVPLPEIKLSGLYAEFEGCKRILIAKMSPGQFKKWKNSNGRSASASLRLGMRKAEKIAEERADLVAQADVHELSQGENRAASGPALRARPCAPVQPLRADQGKRPPRAASASFRLGRTCGWRGLNRLGVASATVALCFVAIVFLAFPGLFFAKGHEPTSLQSSAILVRLLSGRKGSSGGDRV